MTRVALRPLAYAWALPTTTIGMLFFLPAILTGGRVRFYRGAVEIYGGFTRLFLRNLMGCPAAMCLGHVILAQDRPCLDHARKHEHVHVKQCERWGPFFLPAYFLFSFLAWKRGQNVYLDNRFEKEAYTKEAIPDPYWDGPAAC